MELWTRKLPDCRNCKPPSDTNPEKLWKSCSIPTFFATSVSFSSVSVHVGPGCASNVGVEDSRKPILVVGDSVRRVAEDSERDKQSLRGGVEHSVRGESEDSVRAEQSVSGEDSERAEHSGGAEDSERAEHSGDSERADDSGGAEDSERAVP